MGIRKLTCAALALAATMSTPGARSTFAEDESASRLETKQVRDDGSVTVEQRAKLVPFPEDEPVEPKRLDPKLLEPKAAESKPLKPAPTSNFKPKFKTPAIRQAQHNEPETKSEPSPSAEPVKTVEQAGGPDAKTPGAVTPATATEPSPLPKPAAASDAAKSQDASGRAMVDQAFAKAKNCSTEADYTEVIDLCRQGVKLGVRKSYDEYTRKLLGWAYNRRGEMRAEAEKNEEALADFEASVHANSTWRAIHNRGVSLAALGRTKDAMADFNRTIEINPKYPNAYFNRGELKYQQSDFKGAVADYTKAIEVGGRDAATYNSRGHALYRLQRFGDALGDYSEAVKIEPDNAAALINRGDIHSELGRYDEAAKDYRAACRVAPKLGRAYQSAAWLMATCPDEHYRNEKLAIEAAEKAVELEGEDYRNLSTLAAAQASAGLFSEARETQERAIAKAAQKDLVTAEKMMALYHRELAYRDPPVAREQEEPEDGYPVRQASGTEPLERNSTAQRPQRPAAPPRQLPQRRPPSRQMPRGRY